MSVVIRLSSGDPFATTLLHLISPYSTEAKPQPPQTAPPSAAASGFRYPQSPVAKSVLSGGTLIGLAPLEHTQMLGDAIGDYILEYSFLPLCIYNTLDKT